MQLSRVSICRFYQLLFIVSFHAFGISAVFIFLSKSSHGTEEFQRLMAADILFAPVEEVVKTAVIYAVIGMVIVVSRYKTTGILKDIFFSSPSP